jgi:cellulose biosynthesis protein BcsQ
VTGVGTVLTFYSYKGGVGRTLALANAGALLSSWGYRVLCIDWDLEAPGLHLYFERWIEGDRSPGLVELAADPSADWRSHVTTVRFPEAPEPLDLIPAGRFDETYVKRMQTLNWEELYRDEALGERLEKLRSEWKEEYDFILIDSRTGVTDIGGICTIQMPDQLVLLFTANHQSLEGVLEVAKRAAEQRNRLPFDRAGVPAIPVPTRFDGRVQFELAKEWLDVFASRLEPLYREWADRDVEPRKILDLVRIPYIAFWSFGEKMPVLDEGTRDPESLGFALETLTALLAHHLSGTDLLIRSRDELVASARKRQAVEDFRYDAFLSYPIEEAELATKLAESLKTRGLKVYLLLLNVEDRKTREEVSREIESSRSFVILPSRKRGKIGKWQEAELTYALRLLYEDRERGRRIVPVLLEGADARSFPPVLQSFQSVDFREGDPESLDRIASMIRPAS